MTPPDTESRPIRVLLVDDHEFFRLGVRSILTEHGFQVVGEAGTGEEALALLGRRRPDIVLMDLNMPGMSGVEATGKAAAQAGSVPIVMLTVSGTEEDVVDALEAGAAGYLLKDSSPEEIVRGIQAAVTGEAPLSPHVARHLVARARAGPGRMEVRQRVHAKMTGREIEILRLVAEGLDNTQIADRLHLSPTTVKHHVSAILAKLEVTNRVQAAIQGVRAGLI